MHSYLEISKHALRNNIQEFRRYTQGTRKIIAVVKANAYGHGLRQVVPAIDDVVDAFAVDDVDELTEARGITNKDIYMLGYIAHDEIRRALELKGIMLVYDTETLRLIQQKAEALGRIAEVNLKVDALLGRQGVLVEDMPEILECISACPNIRLRGIYAHFANIEDTDDPTHTQNQISAFKEACEIAEKYGFGWCEKHMSSTAGALIVDEQHPEFTHIRLGIGLYGRWPSPRIKEQLHDKIHLLPAVRWVSCVAQVKDIPRGFFVGYGCTYQAPRDMKIAVIPQGYSDGYDREFSNNGEVLIRGQRAPVCGRIAMNMFVVDVTDIEGASLEDEVVLLGKQQNAEISSSELSAHMDSISYEVISRLSPLLERRLT